MTGVVKATIAGVAFFAVLVLRVAADFNIVVVLIAAFFVQWLLRRIP